MVWTASTVQRTWKWRNDEMQYSSKHQVSARHQAHNGDMHHSFVQNSPCCQQICWLRVSNVFRETVDLAQNKFTHDALRYILPHCGWSEHIREVVVGSVLTERKRDETGKPEHPDKTYVHIYIDSRYCQFKPLTVTWSLPLFLMTHFMTLQPRLEPIFQIRKDLDFMITKSFLDVAEIIPTRTSRTAPSLRFAVLRTAQPRVCDLSIPFLLWANQAGRIFLGCCWPAALWCSSQREIQ